MSHGILTTTPPSMIDLPPKGKGKGPPPPTNEEFVAMYDRDGDGEVSMDEFLDGLKGSAPGGPSK